VVGQSDYYGDTNRQAIKPGTEAVKRKPKRNELKQEATPKTLILTA